MRCHECVRWQGRKGHKFGDCYCILDIIIPDVINMCNFFGFKLRTPFDPHDCKYFDPFLRKQLEAVAVPKGVRKDIRLEEDIIYDEQGGERIAKVKVTYFQTHRDFSCGKENYDN